MFESNNDQISGNLIDISRFRKGCENWFFHKNVKNISFDLPYGYYQE